MKYVKNAVWVRGACKNPVGLSMYEVHIETVQYTWVNIWCMLDWILLRNCRNVLPLHTVDQTVRSAKNEMFYLSEPCITHKPDQSILDCKSLCVLSRVIACNSQKFEKLYEIQTLG